MALKFEKHTIETAGGTLAVRGLTTPDIYLTLSKFSAEIMAIAVTGTSNSNAEAALARIVLEFPQLAGFIVAVASDEPESAEEAAKYPFGVLFHALTKILELTFASEGGFANFTATVLRLLALLGQNSNLYTNSENGSAPSTVAAPS
jgi:hypothetical protein